MGFVLSKFRRKKPSNKECLEKVEKELRDISRFQVDTELQQKRIIGKLLVFSSVIYLLFAAVFYFLAPRGLKWGEQLLYALPFVIFPVLMWLIKRCIIWYYDNKIVSNREKYNDLKKEKERLLEDVMDNETFKVAKEILEKYAPSHLLPKYLAEQQKAISMSPMPLTPNYSHTPQSMSFQEGLRRRQMSRNSVPAPTSFGIQRPNMPNTPTMRPILGSYQGHFLRQPANAFPRAIMPSSPATGSSGLPISPRLGGTTASVSAPSYMLPLPPVNPVVQDRGRGWLDKLVDYVVGDGASHRYALICRYCATHNGLATPEDFPYTGFRCVFCRQFNPPRQVRPAAQRLPVNTVLIEELEQSSSTVRDDASCTSNVEETSPNLHNKESLEETSNNVTESNSDQDQLTASQDEDGEISQSQETESCQSYTHSHEDGTIVDEQEALSNESHSIEKEFSVEPASTNNDILDDSSDETAQHTDECSSGFVIVDKSVTESESP